MKKVAIILTLFIVSICYSQSDNLQIINIRDIDFQQIIPGINKTITETSPYAGKFIVKGNGKAMTVSLSFNISQNISSGSKSIPVKYTATKSNISNDNQPGTPFDPYAGTTLTFDDKSKDYYIKIGGTINPSSIQSSGAYISPVIIILTIISK